MIILIIHIIISYDQNISLIFYVNNGSHVRLRHPSCVYISAQRQYTAVLKMCTLLKWLSLPYILGIYCDYKKCYHKCFFADRINLTIIYFVYRYLESINTLGKNITKFIKYVIIKKLSFGHKLKISKPNIFKTWWLISLIFKKIYDIGLQKYWDKNIRVCDKSSIPLNSFDAKF